jgi:MSHA biogenesis protein MshG
MHMELPWQTRLLIGISEFFVNWWQFMLAGLVLLVFALRYYVRTEEGKYRWDKLKLRLPIVGDIILRATLSRFARSFAMSTRAGVPLIQALGVVAQAVDNDYIGERIRNMRNGIERGDSLTRTAAASAMFTPLVLQMMAVGEETGAVDAMMEEVAGFYEREVDYDLKNLSSAIEPILIIAVGVMVLILALGVFLPMWDLTQLARR